MAVVVAEEVFHASELPTISVTDREGAARAMDPAALAEIVREHASSGRWLPRVRLRADRRWYERIFLGSNYDVWVISWMPGQSTGFHDHGASAGAFVVTTGSLEEHQAGEQTRALGKGCLRAFGPQYAHDVRNVSDAPAVSIHAYSPPLTEMNEYELEESGLVLRSSPKSVDYGPGSDRWLGARSHVTIDEMLAAARARVRRLSAHEAYEACVSHGALLVDIRPERQRKDEGSIEGALIVERNVLEWRFDPASSARLPGAESHDLQVIVFCSEGYTSSLAAATLQDLGLWRATDIAGGFKAWREQGLPIHLQQRATLPSK